MNRVLLVLLGLVSLASEASITDLKFKEVCRPSSVACHIGKHSAGVGLGWSRFKEQTAFWPKISVEVGVVPRLALELIAGTVNVQQIYHSLSVAPALILGGGLKFYPLESYHGPVLSLALVEHLYRQDLSNQRYSAQSAIISTLGWRWRPKDLSGSFMLGAGAQREFVDGAKIQPAVETQIAVDFNFDDLFF